MKKSTLLIAFHFPPQSASSGIQRTLSFSKNLGKNGWTPMVLSASPLAYDQKNSSQLADLPPDLLVKRAFALDAKRHMGIAGRYPELLALPDRWITWWLSGVLTGLSMIRKHKPKVIWSTFPIASAHLIGLTLQKLTGLPWVADFRDPMMQATYPEGGLQRRCFKWIEEHAVRRCSKAVFTTFSARDAYIARYPDQPASKFAVIENGYDEDGFSGAPPGAEPQALASDQRVHLLHSGVLYAQGRDPSATFEALARLQAKGKLSSANFRLTLRATGEPDYFHELVKKFGVQDLVAIEPQIPYRDALREMMEVHGLLVFQGTPFNTQVPAKIYEYFRTRKPIFGLLDTKGETARVLRNAGFDSMATMTDSAAIETALENFIAQIRAGDVYVASQELVDSSSRTHRAKQLASIFDEVTCD